MYDISDHNIIEVTTTYPLDAEESFDTAKDSVSEIYDMNFNSSEINWKVIN